MLAEFTDTAIDFDEDERTAARRSKLGAMGRFRSEGIVDLKQDIKSEDEVRGRPLPGEDHTPTLGGTGMFFYVVEEGQRVLMRRYNGTMEILVGPRRVWRGWSTFQPMRHFVAAPGKFLIVRYRDGQQRHLPGPAEIWFDPREHLEIVAQDALQLAAKEAVVVYSKPEGAAPIARRIVYGPALFIPAPGEWLHTFSWHASHGGSLGVQKQPNALVFQKLNGCCAPRKIAGFSEVTRPASPPQTPPAVAVRLQSEHFEDTLNLVFAKRHNELLQTHDCIRYVRTGLLFGRPEEG
jgi:hypothetical protein